MFCLTCAIGSVPSSSDSRGLGEWFRGDSGVTSESWFSEESAEGLQLSSGVVRVDVPFVGPKVPYIASSVDASFIVPLKAPCVMSSVCILSSCTDGGQFSVMQPDVPTCVLSGLVCSLTTCTVVELVQFNVMCQDVKRDLTCDQKFLIPVKADRNMELLPYILDAIACSWLLSI